MRSLPRVAVAELEHDHRDGPASCEHCSQHDHSDRRIVAHYRGVEIKAWEVVCPKCGSTEIVVNRWTEVGKRLMTELTGAQWRVPAGDDVGSPVGEADTLQEEMT